MAMSRTVPALYYQIPKHSTQHSAAHFKQSFWKGKKNSRYSMKSIFYQSPASISHGDVAFWWKEQNFAN